jgi:hypothetical protein
MRNVKMLRTEPNFVSIPAEMAIYCENCENVSNSTRRRCGVCGSESIFSLTTLIDGPPSGPNSGPRSGRVYCSDSALRGREGSIVQQPRRKVSHAKPG